MRLVPIVDTGSPECVGTHDLAIVAKGLKFATVIAAATNTGMTAPMIVSV